MTKATRFELASQRIQNAGLMSKAVADDFLKRHPEAVHIILRDDSDVEAKVRAILDLRNSLCTLCSQDASLVENLATMLGTLELAERADAEEAEDAAEADTDVIEG